MLFLILRLRSIGLVLTVIFSLLGRATTKKDESVSHRFASLSLGSSLDLPPHISACACLESFRPSFIIPFRLDWTAKMSSATNATLFVGTLPLRGRPIYSYFSHDMQ